MYVYETAPIDFWNGCTLLEDHIKISYGCTKSDPQELNEEKFPLDKGANISLQELLDFFNKAVQIARNYGHFEGDFREGPYISALPDPDDVQCQIIIMWKQNNNGSTFIASQRELEWLKGWLIY